ncbi:YhbD family protein [Paenibacillus sp. 2TAB19]|uniref:YhbD family protein n=1 Tax=Paenibacillus sp. 2TAB19 TaxID=3233003 RepID=UPI003F9E3F4A
MDDELISKKELLELTGISYGQLYRWKRKNLVPEDWFIRKSAFTGQETFFPKQRMLARIDKIINMKDDLSLDELAEVFSPTPAGLALSVQQLIERNIVTNVTADFAEEQMGRLPLYTFEQTMYFYILDQSLLTGEMSLDEGKNLLRTLTEHYPKFEGKPCDLYLIRKMGVSTFFLMASGSELYMESGVRIALHIPIAKCIEELKLKLSSY